MLKRLIFIALFVYCASARNHFTNNVGRLHLSEQKWEIQHVLNLTEYMETTDILKECIDNLKTVCKDGENPLCSYFQRATENLNLAIETDTSKLKILARRKRFIIFIPIVIGVSIVSLLSGIFLAKSAIDSIKDDVRENLKIIEQAANISIAQIEMMKEFIKDNDDRMASIQSAINNNTRNIELQTRFFNIINVISFSAQLHERMQIKLNDIYYGDIDSRLFEIIDYHEFLNTMGIINVQLGPNLSLPNITSMSKNRLIKTYTDFNSTHLTVSVDLPVIRKNGFDISEFIPLPIDEKEKTYLLDIPVTTYYVNDSKILLFPDENTKKALCKSQDSLTVCNTFLEDYHVNASICLHNILNNNSDIGCTYKEIPRENYFIQLSHEVLYFYLVYPIKIVMDCRGKVFAMTLTKSGKIYLPKGCEVYKYTDEHFYGSGRISQLDITPPNVHVKLNLSNTGESKKLSYLPLWDKYNLQFIESKGKVTRFKHAVLAQRENLDKIPLIPNFSFSDFFNNTFVQITIFAITIALGLLIFKSLVIKLLTNWKFSSRSIETTSL